MFIAEIEGGGYYEPSRLRFGEFARKWLKEYAEPNLAPKTVFPLPDMIEQRIIPALGHLVMDKIKPLHIVSLKTASAGRGQAGRYTWRAI